MNPLIAAILLIALPAWADDAADRCARGITYADKGDLPRASLYLDGCTDDASTTAAATVAKKLRASNLSALSISTTPAGLTATTDALPGEHFTTPATIYAKAGTYTVTVETHSQKVTVQPRSRALVVIDAQEEHRTPVVKDGKVDFNDETPEPAHVGPPPDQKHGSILPKKYLGQMDSSGPELDDPFAHRSDSHLAWRLGARVGGGIVSDGSTGMGMSVAALASRPLDGPVFLATRVDYNHARALDTIGINAGIAVKLAETSALVLSAGAALRGEIHLQDTLAMEPVARAGIGGAADLDLALLPVPLALGLRYEQGFTELVPGAHDHSLLLEAGYDWR